MQANICYVNVTKQNGDIMNLLALIISALCEAFWNILLTKSKGITDWGINLLGIFFLTIGIITFKKALSEISLSTAVVIWSGLSLILTIIMDVFIFKTNINYKVAFFMLLSIVSILGLHYYSHHK
jgi:multidrug transporter EmrE-like cation transporter